MKLNCPVSVGEFIDKLSILKIKKRFISSQEKLKQINKEEDELIKSIDNLSFENFNSFLNNLMKVNSELWKIEDRIREKESLKEFDEEFIKLARLVYITNDKRFKIKDDINKKYGSEIKEVKSYKKY